MKRENQGYEIIDSITIGNAELVLGKNKANEYVTWQCKNQRSYFWGHYFGNDMYGAKKDLYERVLVKIDIQKELAKQQENQKGYPKKKQEMER